MTYWYRIEDFLTSGTDEYGDHAYTMVNVSLHKYEVLSLTRCGAWLDIPFQGKRFARRDARRRFACPTIKEAAESFAARKERQTRILNRRISQINEALGLVKMNLQRWENEI